MIKGGDSHGAYEQGAIVTGAAQGIGKAIAARLVKDGMRVAIVDINQEAAVAAAEELAGQYGAETMAVQCDVSQEEQVNTAVQKVLERFGTVDVLVNNAGILSLKKPFVEYTKADWDKIFGINFMGDVFFCKALIPTMKEKKSGRIINMASQSAETGGLARLADLRRQQSCSLVHDKVPGRGDGALSGDRQCGGPRLHHDRDDPQRRLSGRHGPHEAPGYP